MPATIARPHQQKNRLPLDAGRAPQPETALTTPTNWRPRTPGLRITRSLLRQRQRVAYRHLAFSSGLACLSISTAWLLGCLTGPPAGFFLLGSLMAHFVGCCEVTQTVDSIALHAERDHA